MRLLNTGQVNKNDPNDARSVAVAALRTHAARALVAEDETAVMKLWARRHHDLGRIRTQLVCWLHAVLCDLVPGGFLDNSLRHRRFRSSPTSLSMAQSPPLDSSWPTI